ncbi:enoyl-CoA hydratase/carnithine racemase [Galbibacter orientalis DSM 19592]|uniref:Enoyl-CoA hydratase/carnithine racemase n=1 Tax=Galbibacter orientalis DSM 19592 TaxID=926559 RepID=I3CAS1_9FLAO|nr:enoyl-CoA hydratase/isomerase family protein [Galbibacter orientalis]EIJ40714.1 enoyl-CoA hydratase/carnithine racemase [Galbibacter orientalis DSM 19592]
MNDNPSHLSISKVNGVAIISLNRPKANSYSKEFLEQIYIAIDEASEDPHIKIILLKSASEKFFCAGADIKIFSRNTTKENIAMVVAARKVSDAIVSSPKIVIAAVSGHALGGGLEIVMACDIRLASEGDYLIGLPEVKLGLMPGNGGTPRLIDLIGVSRAMELLVTGHTISPQKAYDYGLFHQLYNKTVFNKEVENYVNELASGAGQAMKAIKEYIKLHKGMTAAQALDFENSSVNTLYDTYDAKEGFLAFIEKRTPKFK